MVIAQGEVWWADIGEPIGSALLPEVRLEPAALFAGLP